VWKWLEMLFSVEFNEEFPAFKTECEIKGQGLFVATPEECL
jgi:hypothetical protein